MTSDSIKRRIKALRERTTEKGCTEAEALAAAAKAAEMMRAHGLDDADLVMTEEGVSTRTPVASPKALLWPSIATCTNCMALVSERSSGREVTFFGRDPGPEVAVYLFDVCENAVKHEVAKFRAGEFYQRRRSAKTKRKAVDDFTLGLVQRLVVRLRQIFAETRSEGALAEASAYLDRRHPRTGSIKQKAAKTRFDEAANAGWKAGGNVTLAHGVNGGGDRKLIGGAA